MGLLMIISLTFSCFKACLPFRLKLTPKKLNPTIPQDTPATPPDTKKAVDIKALGKTNELVSAALANSIPTQTAKDEKKIMYATFSIVAFMLLSHQVLSAVTTVVADVAWSEATDRAVADISKSN